METPSREIIVAENGLAPSINFKLATDVAGICKQIVLASAINIQGKKYVRAEGWMALATAHGCIASTRDVERVEGGFRCIAELKKASDGTILSTAEGFLGDDEPTWQKRPEYARRSMVQTRAVAKVCRIAFAHCIVLMDCGLSTTPAEELAPDGGFDNANTTTPEKTAKAREVAAPATSTATGGEKHAGEAHSEQEPASGSEPQGWQDVVIHFGKNKNIRLGDLEPQQLRWYQKEWQPRPFRGRISDQDQALRNSLDESMGKQPSPFMGTGEDEELNEIPF